MIINYRTGGIEKRETAKVIEKNAMIIMRPLISFILSGVKTCSRERTNNI